MARTSLPPGFRFHPTDIELIMYHLKRKILGKKVPFEAISELNIYKFSPWDLPDKSCLKSKDLEWYFFCPRERKYASGERMKRGTESGYWKTTGKDRVVVYDERVVGKVKTLVFHEGSAPQGKRTDWVAYEYRMDDKKLTDAGIAQDSYVLYKVFKKNGPGPKNGAQYGAPFKEEEWEDDEDSGIPVDSLPSDGPSPVVLTVPENQISAASKSMIGPISASGLTLIEAGPSGRPSLNKVPLDGLNNSMVMDVCDLPSTSGWALTEQGQSSAGPSANDIPYSPENDIAHLLEAFFEDGTGFPNEEENYECGKLDHARGNVPLPYLDGNDAFNGLEDLSNWADLNGGVNLSGGQGHNVNNMLPQDDMAFLELNDLDAPLNFSVDTGGFGKIPTGGSYAACTSDASAHVLTGISSEEYSSNADLGRICHNVNFPCSETLFPKSSQSSLLPISSGGHVHSTNVFSTGNAYGNNLNQGITAGYGFHFFPYSQPEESRDAAENQERAGMPQRKFFSRLQQLLESFPVHPASVAEHLAPSNSAYGGSSIHVKAEVTRRFSAGTKDALSVMLGESTYDHSCWWNLHGAEFWKKAADCSSGSVVFYFGLMVVFMWFLVFSLSLLLGCRLLKCISFFKMICLL